MVAWSLDSETEKTLCESLARARGDGSVIGSAFGAFVLGSHIGFKGLRMIHNHNTLQRYGEILGLSLKETLPDTTDQTKRVRGVRVAPECGGYWAVAMGRSPVAGKGVLEDG